MLAKFAAKKKEERRKDSNARQVRSKKIQSARVVELEATIRTSRIGIVVEFGTARLLQPQSHAHSSHLVVGRWALSEPRQLLS